VRKRQSLYELAENSVRNWELGAGATRDILQQHVTRGKSTEIGGRPFLAKPVDPDVVLACIEKYAR
jgi:hypothetical protein